jgi:membrane protease YdiL (CAAX protease family)
MSDLIPTPEVVVIARAVVALGCLASASTAGIVVRLLQSRRAVSYWAIYCGLLCSITALALGIDRSSSASWPEGAGAACVAVGAAVVGALLCIFVEDLLLIGRITSLRRAMHVASRGWRPGSPRDEGEPVDGRLSLLLCIAVLEELVFRGVGLGIAAHLPGVLAPTGWLVLVTGAFALSHHTRGPGEVRGKAVLGTGALVVALVSGTILSAILLHVAYNFIRWAEACGDPQASGVGPAPVRKHPGSDLRVGRW